MDNKQNQTRPQYENKTAVYDKTREPAKPAPVTETVKFSMKK